MSFALYIGVAIGVYFFCMFMAGAKAPCFHSSTGILQHISIYTRYPSVVSSNTLPRGNMVIFVLINSKRIVGCFKI